MSGVFDSLHQTKNQNSREDVFNTIISGFAKKILANGEITRKDAFNILIYELIKSVIPNLDKPEPKRFC